MNALRHYLLVVLLVCAQLAVGAHAVEHALGNDEAIPTHTCELCLAAHDLGAALPSLAVLPPLVLPGLPTAFGYLNDRPAWPAPVACQRGPPVA